MVLGELCLVGGICFVAFCSTVFALAMSRKIYFN